jgi:ribosome-binding protein aMBF1 (putative translation factor)
MLERKRRSLEARGWKVGSAQEFLGLSAIEAEYIDLRLRLADGLKKKRLSKGVTQMELAKRMRSSQSRVAKMEAGDDSVSLDLIVRSILCLGTTRNELARILSSPRSSI